MTRLAPPSQQALSEAADWMLKQQEAELETAQKLAFDNWLAASEQHRFAWQLAEKLTASMQSVPAGVGHHVFRRKHPSRRTLLKSLAALMVLPAASWGLYSVTAERPAETQYATAPGKTQRIRLDDGSRLLLNTRTTVRVSYTAESRRIWLDAGEVFVVTANDPLQRDFWVETAQGRIRALGTEFIVRQLTPQQTRVSVLEHAVMVQPAGSVHGQRLQAGQQLEFNANTIIHIGNRQSTVTAWTQHQLIADNMALGEFIAELGRYRPGLLRCDPVVAELPISGVFQLGDTDEVLRTLAKTLPVRVFYRSRDWVMILPDK